MKKLLLLFSLLLLTITTFANKIDSLKTDSDVIKFIRPLDKRFVSEGYHLAIHSTEGIIYNFSCDPLAKTWGIKNWQKLDLNNDKRTDLLTIVYQYGNYTNYIAVDNGDNTFKLIRINYDLVGDCELISTLNLNKQNLVVFHGHNFLPPKKGGIGYTRLPKTDTLTYKFGNLVELNKQPSHYKIDSITFSAGMCFGTCPAFKIKFDKIGSAEYIAGEYSPKMGTFKGSIKTTDLKEIYDLIDYISIKKLRDQYTAQWTDDRTYTIRVKFTDGSVKYISDYGARGTFGLKNLYDKFVVLPNTQDWK